MTREELDFIGSMNMCDEISNEAYKKIVCHCREQEPCPNAISRSDMLDAVGHGTTYTSEELQGIIKGLPSVNPQPCEDAISREDAIKQCGFGMTSLLVADCLRRLPSVNPLSKDYNTIYYTPQPKTGHWIKTGYIDKVMCSICNRKMWNFWEVNDFNYCPSCGAKMEREA